MGYGDTLLLVGAGLGAYILAIDHCTSGSTAAAVLRTIHCLWLSCHGRVRIH